jgi:hypothetical protein
MSDAKTQKDYLTLLMGVMLGLFALVWCWTYFARMAFVDGYGQWGAQLQMIRSCNLAPTVVLGDSRASAAFLPRLLGFPAKNLALTGSTPIEVFYEMQEILACPNHPSTIILSLSSRQYEEINWLWESAVRNDLLSRRELDEIAKTEQELGTRYLYHGVFGSEPPPVIKNWLYAAHFPPFDFASLLRTAGVLRFAENRRGKAATLASDGQHYIGEPSPNSCAPGPGWEATQSEFKPNTLILHYFDRLIELAKKRGVKLVITSTPVSKLTQEAMKPAFVSAYASLLDRYRKANDNLTVVGPLVPVLGNCHFSDMHHLNQHGAEAFSRQVGRLLTGGTAEADADTRASQNR